MLLPVFATTAVLTLAALIAIFPATLAPLLAQALGVPASLIGVQISFLYVGAVSTSLLGGGITERFGACRTSQLSLLALGGGALLATVPSLVTFSIASVLIGLGYGMTNPAASHLLMRFTPVARRGLIFSIKQTGVPLGGVLAGLVAPPLALLLGWQAAFVTVGVAALLGAVLLQPLHARWDDDRDRSQGWAAAPLSGLTLVWRYRPLRYISLAGTCFAWVQLSLAAFTVVLLVEELDFTLVAAGAVMAGLQFAGAVGRIVWGAVADRLRGVLPAFVLISGMSMTAATLVTVMSPDWPTALVAAVMCLFGASALGWNGIYLAEVARLAPEGRVAAASGGSLVFTFCGVLFGAPAFTLLHALLGSYQLAFGVLTLVCAVGLACFVASSRAWSRESLLGKG